MRDAAAGRGPRTPRGRIHAQGGPAQRAPLARGVAQGVLTIGFTKKSARQFFGLLRESGAKRVVDVRLNNASQLAGFAKKGDLAWFLDRICGLGHLHLPQHQGILAYTSSLETKLRR